jgi:hypothetical protein
VRLPAGSRLAERGVGEITCWVAVGTEDDGIPHQLVGDAAHQLGHGSPVGSRIRDGSDRVESGATSLPKMQSATNSSHTPFLDPLGHDDQRR